MRQLEDTPTRTPAAAGAAAPWWAAVLAGVLAAAVALAAGELVAGLLTAPSPVVAVGDRVIDLAPPAVKDAAIALFGTADKVALVIGILILAAAFGAGLGIAAARRFAAGAAGLGLFAALGVLAALQDAQSSLPQAVFPSVAGAAAGILTLRRALPAPQSAPVTLAPAPAAPPRPAADSPAPAPSGGFDRRMFLRRSATLGAVALVASVSGRWLQTRANAAASRAQAVLGRPVQPLPPVPASADLGVRGLSPFITPNSDFYRIDTALRVPQVATEGWRLGITGMVDRPLTLTYEQLQSRKLVEADITLACVSNEVGGNLIGNARWLGVRLDDLLAEAGVHDGATQIVGRAVDGFTVGFPTEVGLDGRDALVAIGMNGEPLPVEHGFPARLVVPGLYGYVSATKWLTEIELTTLEAFDAYWVPRGWAKQAPIKTQSRIDVPSPFGEIPPGPTAVAGVAWAPTRGIEGVEVQVDDGPWAQARLADEAGGDTWRQWIYEWDAPAGQHRLRVRATDGTGQTQTDERAPPAPDGATGWHSVVVSVEET
ncbi:MAG: molybdopterin-dependent oxidoreductase [Nitriliruptorales bacterium]|nr:molybdopterin-dependent oxidoreductase [Nitriliruptorales bacterium]